LSLTPEEYASHSTGQAQELSKRGRFSKVSISYDKGLHHPKEIIYANGLGKKGISPGIPGGLFMGRIIGHQKEFFCPDFSP
jgi:hypothetical protein